MNHECGKQKGERAMNYPYATSDDGFSPPAPVALVHVSFQISQNESARSLRMLVDSGSDCCFIPRVTILELEAELGTSLPYDLIEVEGISGKPGLLEAYYLDLEAEGLGRLSEVRFVALDRAENGILGRDVLNRKPIFLDGPNYKWEIAVE